MAKSGSNEGDGGREDQLPVRCPDCKKPKAYPDAESARSPQPSPVRIRAPEDHREGGNEYSFEIIKHYPCSRSYQIKKPLKKSFIDSIMDLVGRQ